MLPKFEVVQFVTHLGKSQKNNLIGPCIFLVKDRNVIEMTKK